MPGDGMAKMIQMLSVLSGIQMAKRQQTLAEQQAEEQKRQFGVSMGFNEKSAQYKKIADLIDAISKSSTESRGALVELGQSLGLDPQSIQALAHYGQTSPESLEMMKTQDVAAGRAAMPPGQRAMAQGEAAMGAMTGMNQGQAAMSQLQSVLAGGGDPTQAYGKDMLRNMVQGFGERAATGRDPLTAAAQGQIMADPKLLGQYAGIQAGNTTPYQTSQLGQGSRQLDIAGQQANTAAMGVTADFYRTNAQIISNAQDAALKGASAKAMGGLTADQITAMTNSLRETMQAITKEKNPAGRKFLESLYNNLARQLNVAPITSSGEEPEPPGYMQRMNPQTPGPSNPPFSWGPSWGQQMPPSPMFNTPQPTFLQPNPLSPFVRP